MVLRRREFFRCQGKEKGISRVARERGVEEKGISRVVGEGCERGSGFLSIFP